MPLTSPIGVVADRKNGLFFQCLLGKKAVQMSFEYAIINITYQDSFRLWKGAVYKEGTAKTAFCVRERAR